jgi:uncharacterized membrane protein
LKPTLPFSRIFLSTVAFATSKAPQMAHHLYRSQKRLAWAVSLLFGSTSLACALDAGQSARLQERDVLITVSPDSAGADGLIEAAIEINAPRKQVWDVMVDCARAPNFLPSLKSCQVLDADPDGSWDVREHRISWLAILPDTRSIFRSTYTKHELIKFERSGGDLKILEGAWRLESVAGDRTRVFYRSRIGLSLPVPAFMLRSSLEADVPKFLKALRNEIELN